MKHKFTALLTVLFATALFISCGDKKNDYLDQLKQETLVNYANLVYTSYDDSYNTAAAMKQAIDAFLANPTASGFEACKTAWLFARNPYGQTEAYRFYGGPIDNADGPEGLINAWPIDESYIDYVVGDPNAGLINAPSPAITKALLVGLNELFSEESIFTGWHAIEFLLWGQDLSTTGPGERPYTDYVVGAGGTASNPVRRGQYLQVASELLLEHIAQVRDEWKPGGAYREEFLNQKRSEEAMGLIFFGLREFTVTELAGERMFVAIDTKDQEHEHSCFADNTIADIKMNLLGIKNVYYGTYVHSDGKTLIGRSFNDLVNQYDSRRAAAMFALFADAEAKVNAIPEPFDQAIVHNPAPIEAAIEALNELGEQLAQVGRLIGAEF